MFFGKKHKVIVKNKNITIEAKSGTDLFKLLTEHGINIPSLCSGNGQCGKCKIHISANPLQKPTKKERLILARMSLDDGYRLACQYIIKSDIIVNTDDFFDKSADNSDLFGIKVIESTKNNDTQEITPDVLSTNTNNENAGIQTENSQSEESGTASSDSDITTQSSDTSITAEPDEEFNPTDGLLLIQYPRGIKYYVYSAGINNVSSDGFIKTDENLVDLIDNNSICDFIYNCTDVRDIERIFIILHKKYYNGTSKLGLINYYSFQLGTLLCEIIQPENNPKDMLTFLRLIRSNENNLIFHFDNLTNIFFKQKSSLTNINCAYIANDINIDPLLECGDNPINSISDDLLKTSVTDEYKQPTGINFSTLLKTITLLDKAGIIDSDLKLMDRNNLLDKIPLDVLVKLSSRGGTNKFYIYRKNNLEIFVSQDIFDILLQLKTFITSVINYAESKLGKIDLITFDTINKYDNMTNELLDLNIIPSKYSKKLIHLTGDPTIFATKFFNEKSLKDFLDKNFSEYKEIELYKDNHFNEINN